MSDRTGFVPYTPDRLEPDAGLEAGAAFYERMNRRRSVRFFSEERVPREMVEIAIRAAGTAPSGAHMEPWTFVAISSAEIKRKIREAAEEEERTSYDGRMSEEWRQALAPLGTDWRKPYLETVPWIVVLFAQSYGHNPDGSKKKHYYVKESVGIAAGLFIAALHEMGLATLTHTPSPMGFLTEILGRPANERPYILFPIGYPTEDCVVPDLERKGLDALSVWFEDSPAD